LIKMFKLALFDCAIVKKSDGLTFSFLWHGEWLHAVLSARLQFRVSVGVLISHLVWTNNCFSSWKLSSFFQE
jgi:hypothetical protein